MAGEVEQWGYFKHVIWGKWRQFSLSGKSELLVRADKGFARKTVPNVKCKGQGDEES